MLDMQYTLTYAEESRTPTSKSWTIRQVGVFNRVVPPCQPTSHPITTPDQAECQNQDPNLLFLLYPQNNPPLQKRLLATQEAHAHSECKPPRNPPPQPFFTTHLLILSTYFPAWRFYLSHLNAEMEAIADVALTLEFSQTSHYTEGYTQLRKLKHLEDKVLPLTARFQTTLATVQKLMEVNEILHEKSWCEEKVYREMRDELRAYETHSKGHLITVALLQRRVSEILNLVSQRLSAPFPLGKIHKLGRLTVSVRAYS